MLRSVLFNSHSLSIKNQLGLEILQNVSINIFRDQIMVLNAPHGHGKTEFIMTLLRYIDPLAGDFQINGMPYTTYNAESLRTLGIGFVPEDRQIFSHLTVEDNLICAFFAKHCGVIPPFIKDKLDRIYSLFPFLKNRRKQIVKTLSGGEQQQLCIARTIMIDPEFIILDEPFQGLSFSKIQEVLALFSSLNQESGIGFLLSDQSHFSRAIPHAKYFTIRDRQLIPWEDRATRPANIQ